MRATSNRDYQVALASPDEAAGNLGYLVLRQPDLNTSFNPAIISIDSAFSFDGLFNVTNKARSPIFRAKTSSFLVENEALMAQFKCRLITVSRRAAPQELLCIPVCSVRCKKPVFARFCV